MILELIEFFKINLDILEYRKKLMNKENLEN